jgi:hypothetical protein
MRQGPAEGGMSVTPANPTLERLADAVAERLLPRLAVELATLLEQQARPPELVDAAELARVLGVSRDFVYSNAELLGVHRLGDGNRPRLRFDVGSARAALAGREEPVAEPARAAPRPGRAGGTAPLLPIRGESGRP